MTAKPIVEISDLHVRFKGERTVHALNGVDISLAQGEVLGLLGESGSGKSVTLRALLRMLPPHRTDISGSIKVDGQDVMTLSAEALERLRGGTVSMIFQEPMLALDPVYTIGDQIAEVGGQARERVLRARPPARARNAGARAHSLAEAAARRLSARNVRRHAPARDDRARARLPAEGAARRRADHRARRHRADPDFAVAARTCSANSAWR